jgi:DNA-binding GntR family transcriptional regulator
MLAGYNFDDNLFRRSAHDRLLLMTTVQSKADQRSLPQSIRDQLRDEILRGTLPPGTQLRQENLAERFGASRIPVREALRQLEAEGLVSYQLNRGAVVIAMSTSEICELLDIRAALESYAAKLAVPNMVSADIELMKRILASYDIATTPAEWAECNRQFHLALCAPSNNERLKKMIEEYCLSTTNRYPHLRMSLDTQKEDVQRDHYQIVDACKRRAVDEVVTLLEQHILETKREVLAAARLG